MASAYPPHHINSVSINSAGWVVPSARVNDELKSDDISIAKCCQTLLHELKLGLSDVFPSKQSAPTDDGAPTALPDLIHRRDIASKIINVINTIRKMGDTHEATDDTKKKRSRDGEKVAQLEEQRRMRKQKEQSNGDKEDGFVPVGEVTEALNQVSLDERFAMTFNSLRVLIEIMRPVLDHPQRRDYNIKMKNGPSIEKGNDQKSRKKARSNYLFFDRVYDVVTAGTLKEIERDIRRMLDDLELPKDVVMKWQKGGVFQHDIVRDIKFILGKGQSYTNEAIVTEQCFGRMPKNFSAKSELHEALMKRFDSATDKKQIALKESIDQLVQKLDKAISDRFSKDSCLTVYGSCLSGLNLNHSHDVDISVHIPLLQKLKQEFDDGKLTAAQYEKRTRTIIYQVRDALVNNKKYGDSFIRVQPITQARVPVVKGVDKNSQNPYSPDGHLHFDLCFGNEIAVVNSSLLREYSQLDKRVRVLMLCVKSFAKTNGISSAADSTFSSYSWLNLVVFYLQCIGFLPVLQSAELMEAHKFKPDMEGNSWHSVNSLETYYLSSDEVLHGGIWKQPDRYTDTTALELLYGFFCFYCEVFPRETVAASIRVGECSIHKAAFVKSSKLWRLCLEDPFETWDSHCPHDLGAHLNENGQKKTTQCLKDGLEAIRLLLDSDANATDKTSALFGILDVPQQHAEIEQGRGGKKKKMKDKKKKVEKQALTNDVKHEEEEPQQQAQNGSDRKHQQQRPQANKDQSSRVLRNSSNGRTNNTTHSAIQQMKDLALKDRHAHSPIPKRTRGPRDTKKRGKKNHQPKEGPNNNDDSEAQSNVKEGNPYKDKTCRNCGALGHITKNCPENKTCRNCGAWGHITKNCPENKTCKNCGALGHFARDCLEMPNSVPKKKTAATVKEWNPDKKKTCGNCGALGHVVKNCPKARLVEIVVP